MSVKAVIFDLDGTLVDSAHVCACVFNAMLAERGLKVALNAQAIQSTLSIGGVEMIRGVFGQYSINPSADLIEFRLRYAAMPTPAESLYPGVVDALTQLAFSGIRLGLCTKKPEALTHKVLEELKIARFFEAVSCGDSTQHPKPDARHLLGVLTTLNASPSDALMVGDSHVDFELAANAQVRFAFARYGYAEGAVREGLCDISFDRLDQLPELIAAIGPGVSVSKRAMAA